MTWVALFILLGVLSLLGWFWYELVNAEMYVDHPFVPGGSGLDACSYFYAVGAASRYCDLPRSAHPDASTGGGPNE